MASLFVIQGRDQGKRFPVEDGVLSVGRDSTNSVQLHDGEVSRRHAEIRYDDHHATVLDLGSSNGTFVNNTRIERQQLDSGDRVQFGRTLMIFTANDSRPQEDLSSIVNIVGRTPRDANSSRIVRSLTQEEGSQILDSATDAASPWLARARSNLQIMYRTALAVSHTLDIDQLLNRILELIFEWVEADRGCVMLVDQQTDKLVPRARRTRQGVSEEERIRISRTILDYVMERKEGVVTSDAKDDSRWDPGGSIVNMGVREAICVPMQGRYGIVGVVYIDTYTPPGRVLQRQGQAAFNEEHLKLMIAIAHQAALAVEDTAYYSAMVQAERLAAMGQTIATLSHHIKNILQGIRGGSYLIEEGLKDEEPDVIRKGWNIVDKNQEKISNLVMDMLTFSKEREPDMAPNDLNEVVGDVIELMQVRAEEAGVSLSWKPSKNLPEVTFDFDALHRAVLNVVTNAIDACQRAGRASQGAEEVECEPCVEVSTKHNRQSETASVIVTDNGEGIAEEDLQKIFTVFESSKGSRGTGLGLPVSQKILHEHGGEIHVISTPGEGSQFTLELPLGGAGSGIEGEMPTEYHNTEEDVESAKP